METEASTGGIQFDESRQPHRAEPDPRVTSLWRGALAIALAGVATIVLLNAVVLQTADHAALLLWVWFGLPLVLAAAAAARISAGRLRPAHLRHQTATAGTSGTRTTSGD